MEFQNNKFCELIANRCRNYAFMKILHELSVLCSWRNWLILLHYIPTPKWCMHCEEALTAIKSLSFWIISSIFPSFLCKESKRRKPNHWQSCSSFLLLCLKMKMRNISVLPDNLHLFLFIKLHLLLISNASDFYLYDCLFLFFLCNLSHASLAVSHKSGRRKNIPSHHVWVVLHPSFVPI